MSLVVSATTVTLVAIWISSTSSPSAAKKPFACATLGATKLSEKLGMPTRIFSSGCAAASQQSNARDTNATTLRRSMEKLMRVQLVDEAAVAERPDEARVDEKLRLRAFRLGIRGRHLSEHGAHAF